MLRRFWRPRWRNLPASRCCSGALSVRNGRALSQQRPVVEQLKRSRDTPISTRRDYKRVIAVLTAAIAIPGLVWYSVRNAQVLDPTSKSLDVNTFRPRRIVGKTNITNTLSIITLAGPPGDSELQDKCNGAWSVEIKQPQLQIARLYSPLPESLDSSLSEDQQLGLSFLIRCEPYGEVSNYLNGLKVGDTVELRGPFENVPLPTDLTNIILIGGGTGIAPLLQIARSLSVARKSDLSKGYNNGSKGTLPCQTLDILWASREVEDLIPVVKHVVPPEEQAEDSLQKSAGSGPVLEKSFDGQSGSSVKQTSYRFFADSHGVFISENDLRNILENCGKSVAHPTGRKMIIISGPQGFISRIAGPKRNLNDIEVTTKAEGLLAAVDVTGWQIVKL